MSAFETPTLDDDLQRAIYAYVERRGAVTTDDLVRSVRIDGGPATSKPARSETYRQEVSPSPERIRTAVESMLEADVLAEVDGALRVAVPAPSVETDLGAGRVRIRPVREEDREGLLETMRAVAGEGTYVVAEDVAERIEREPALVRFTAERPRVIFVAVREPGSAAGEATDEAGASESTASESADAGSEGEIVGANDEGGSTNDGTGRSSDGADAGPDGADREILGWLHVDVPDLPSLSHVSEVTVGVDPDHRREGIGSALLDYGVEWAEDAGYRKLCQSVPATNEDAVEFLEANGWTREGLREEQYRIEGEYVDEVLLATWP